MLISKFDITNIENKVSGFEIHNNVRLPEQYRKFLLKYNGGDTPDTTFKMKARRKEDVMTFYGLGVGVIKLDRHPYFIELMKNGFLSIAEDCFGNEYFIGVAKTNYGKIYFYDHERQSVELARNDFNSFVKSCKSEKLDPDVRLSIEERERQLIEDGYGANITDALRQAWQEEIDFYGNMVQEPVILDESEH